MSDALEPVDEGEFRAALARFATGVIVVSARTDRDHAMTASAFSSVSLDPPLVLVCVESAARFHEAIVDSGVWGVSILPREHRPVAQWLSRPGRPLVGQFDQVPHHRGRLGMVLIDDALATLECRTTAVHPAGDHSIVVGEVLSVGIADRPEDALVYFRSQYGSLA